MFSFFISILKPLKTNTHEKFGLNFAPHGLFPFIFQGGESHEFKFDPPLTNLPMEMVKGGIYQPRGCLYGFTVKLNRCVDITLFFFHGNLWEGLILNI